jgi:type IV pilus assembly protein PilW
MMRTPRLAPNRAHAAAGFSLIELMVGMVIGLLCTIVIAMTLSAAEGQRRGTTQGSDAQVAGSLAIYALQRDVAVAGYGFASESAAVGCELQAFYNGVAVSALPARLAPVIITQGASGAADQVRVLASSKFIGGDSADPSAVGYTVPSRVVGPHYDPDDTTGKLVKDRYNVWSSLSVSKGDLMVAVSDAATPCGLFQVTDDPASGVVPRADDATHWNPSKHPAYATKEPVGSTAGSFLVNLGRILDVIYSVDAQQRLTVSRLNTTTMSRDTSLLQSNIVQLRALYGRDTDDDGVVDTYDYSTPSSNAGWLQVLSVRIAVVARSAQYEREEVTSANPQWDVGTATSVTGSASCSDSKCVEIKIDGLSDWKHYRYKVFDTVVPLRNQRWKSTS